MIQENMRDFFLCSMQYATANVTFRAILVVHLRFVLILLAT